MAEDFLFEELKSLNARLDNTSGLPEDLKEKLAQMLNRLNRMASTGHYAQEFDTLARYIEVVTSIPWDKHSEDILDLTRTKEILDKNHYGMNDVKDRILEYLATMILIKQRGGDAIARSPTLLFVGLQGVGKTTLCISIAEALGRDFVRIAMGALGSTLELRGRSKVFPEAEPGQIIKALIKTQVRNPVILLDEIEKSSGEEGLRSDIMAALLEILDPNQNSSFRDHYVDYPVDLGEILFVCSANNVGKISAALMDRMEVIKMPSYTDQEKIVIAQNYLLPKIIKNNGLQEGELTFDPALWPSVVRPFGFDTGIRSLNRTLETIARKVAKQIVEGKVEQVYITQENLRQYLSPLIAMIQQEYTLEKFDSVRKLGYRPGIVGVFLRDHKILFLYKKEYGIWLLPQGGIENHESLPEALAREMPEEVGVSFVNSCKPEFEVVHEDVLKFTKSKLGARELLLDDGTEMEMIGKHLFFCTLYPEGIEINIKESEYDDYFWMSYTQAKFVNNQVYQETKKKMVDKLLDVLKKREYLK